MTWLTVGLLLFIGVHLVPTFPGARNALIERLGYLTYQGLFSLVAMLGLGLTIFGYSAADFLSLWTPIPWARSLALWLMPVAFVLLVAAYLPTLLRAKLVHPMLIATALWAALHLLANGDDASVLLFGGFLLFAVTDMLRAKSYPNMIPGGKPRLLFDAVALVVGLAGYALVLHFHRDLFGMPVLLP